MFYKHIGNQTRAEAKRLCSIYGDSVHLPIPRFHEENEFFRKYFADETLWLDISRMTDGNFESSYGQLFVREVETILSLEFIVSHNWMNFSNNGSEFVMMTKNGRWETTDDNLKRDSVCVLNILPGENCSKCRDKAFCRFTNGERLKTECVCAVDEGGELCQDDLCSHCQNEGYCKFYDKEANKRDCVCSKPFFGDYCASSKFLNISKSKIASTSQARFSIPNRKSYLVSFTFVRIEQNFLNII